MSAEAPSLRTLLRREESYAMHALVYVAESPGASAARIAEDLQMPAAFMAKVLKRLAPLLVASGAATLAGTTVFAAAAWRRAVTPEALRRARGVPDA